MFKCNICGQKEQFNVYPPFVEKFYNLDGIGIRVNNKGEMLNIFSDGVTGVPGALKNLVEDEDTAECVSCKSEVYWQ